METVIDNQGFEHVFVFLYFSSGDGSSASLSGSSNTFAESLVDWKVGYLVAEEGAELDDIFEDEHDLVHECIDVLGAFIAQ